ncbi:PRC-barrel domain-containing protein [Actinoplanes sp. NPDC051470]|uniref:PRC-barrel domain-containing protein n=1 Tax=Actinoplanes sp. NPDC051470 TaxID=3157224 RepID=UPI00342B44B2
MITRNDIQRLIGTDVYADDGDKIGSAGQVYLDNKTGNPGMGIGQDRPLRHQGVLRAARRGQTVR